MLYLLVVFTPGYTSLKKTLQSVLFSPLHQWLTQDEPMNSSHQHLDWLEDNILNLVWHEPALYITFRGLSGQSVNRVVLRWVLVNHLWSLGLFHWSLEVVPSEQGGLLDMLYYFYSAYAWNCFIFYLKYANEVFYRDARWCGFIFQIRIPRGVEWSVYPYLIQYLKPWFNV